MPSHEYVCISSHGGDASILAFAALRAAFPAKLNYDKGLAAVLVSPHQNPPTAGDRIMFAVQHGIGRTYLQDAVHQRACAGLCVVFRHQEPSE
jgi:hypothetical protein